MALRQHRAQPGGQAAAPMKVPQQRLADSASLIEAVKICVKRIGKLARGARRVERISGAIQTGPHFEDEMIPGRGVSEHTGTRQGQIFEVERGQVSRHVAWCRAARRKRLGAARFERGRKCRRRYTPTLRLRLTIQAVGKVAIDTTV